MKKERTLKSRAIPVRTGILEDHAADVFMAKKHNDRSQTTIRGKNMQMAKATEKDMDSVANLAGILGDIDRGYYPRKANGDQPEEEPTFFDPADANHLRIFYDRVNECLEASPGGLFRVVGGFHTLMHNDIVDPAKDYLSLSPEIIRAKEVSAATEAAIRDYHFALDSREHGAVAMDKALNEIESALGLPWRQGEELDRRKVA